MHIHLPDNVREEYIADIKSRGRFCVISGTRLIHAANSGYRKDTAHREARNDLFIDQKGQQTVSVTQFINNLFGNMNLPAQRALIDRIRKFDFKIKPSDFEEVDPADILAGKYRIYSIDKATEKKLQEIYDGQTPEEQQKLSEGRSHGRKGVRVNQRMWGSFEAFKAFYMLCGGRSLTTGKKIPLDELCCDRTPDLEGLYNDLMASFEHSFINRATGMKVHEFSNLVSANKERIRLGLPEGTDLRVAKALCVRDLLRDIRINQNNQNRDFTEGTIF